MNVTYGGRVIVHFRIEEISCYYFCNHFHKIFKARENDDTTVSFLKSSKKSEIIIYCYSCRDFIRSLFYYLKPLSQRYFEEAKKILIQYLPTVK